MAFDNPVYVTLYDKDDEVIVPITRPISIVYNLEAHGWNYLTVQLETYDAAMREVLRRWNNKELIQYRIEGRFGVDTGDLNSVYSYDTKNTGEFTFYGRSHKELASTLLGFPNPASNTVSTPVGPTVVPAQYSKGNKRYTGKAGQVVFDVIRDNLQTRLGIPIVASGTIAVGEEIDVDFRFDEILKHLYEDGEDRGGVNLSETGNVVWTITRNFSKHQFVYTAREPTRHEQQIEVRSGLLERWQITSDRGEADRVILGGPGEDKARMEVEYTRKAGLTNRRFPAEAFIENTSPEVSESVKPPYEDPTDAQMTAYHKAQLEVLAKYARSKIIEYGARGAVSGTLVESAQLYLGGELKLGDWVKIGVDNELPLGEQQIEKAVITWTVENGYLCEITKPGETESTNTEVLKRVIAAIKELSTRDRRK